LSQFSIHVMLPSNCNGVWTTVVYPVDRADVGRSTPQFIAVPTDNIHHLLLVKSCLLHATYWTLF